MCKYELCSHMENHFETFSIQVNWGGQFFMSLFALGASTTSPWGGKDIKVIKCFHFLYFIFLICKILNPDVLNPFINGGKSWGVYF